MLGYKVVQRSTLDLPGEYFSICAPVLMSVRYEIGEWTYPHFEEYPLFVYKTREAAEKLKQVIDLVQLSELWYTIHVFECEYDLDPIVSTDDDFVYASRVKLLPNRNWGMVKLVELLYGGRNETETLQAA